MTLSIPIDGEILKRKTVKNIIGYISQTAALINVNSKDDILFNSMFDTEQYREVIHVCALNGDLNIFDDGDITLVGERGIILSGGQTQRICVARAIYSNVGYDIMDGLSPY